MVSMHLSQCHLTTGSDQRPITPSRMSTVPHTDAPHQGPPSQMPPFLVPDPADLLSIPPSRVAVVTQHQASRRAPVVQEPAFSGSVLGGVCCGGGAPLVVGPPLERHVCHSQFGAAVNMGCHLL